MITVKLQGGLGNQLFQITAAIGTAEKFNTSFLIPIDWEYRSYFSIPNNNFGNVLLTQYKEPTFHYSEIPQGDFELIGYFQSKKYWEHCEDLVKEYFIPSAKMLNMLTANQSSTLADCISIHIRGGDYVVPRFTAEGGQIGGAEYHYNLESEYYAHAMTAAGLNNRFAIFSDDVPYAKQFYPEQDIISNSGILDFFLMQRCKDNIIANSSFSWWASELNRNPNKRIFAPPKSRWFGEKKRHLNVDDLYCDNWTIVDYD